MPIFNTKDDETKKCVTEESVCTNLGYKFLLGKECKREIDLSAYYKVNYDVGSVSLIKCFSELAGCFTDAEVFFL